MIPLYKKSLEEAVSFNEKDLWLESRKENIRCRNSIDTALAEYYNGFVLPLQCVEDSVKEFGYDRTMWIIASTIRQRIDDGRISTENKSWAKTICPFFTCREYDIALSAHSGLIDGMAEQVRAMYAKLGLYAEQHIQCAYDEDLDYERKILVLRGESLKEEYRTPENQLFYAECGFGCSPSARGRKVFGRFLSDGEEAQFNRADFLGVVKDEVLPEWAKERLSDMLSEKTDEQEQEP